MRAVLQRVSRARVLVDGSVTGEIGPGLVVLVAVVARMYPPPLSRWLRKS